MRLVLASASPRRSELLRQLVEEFDIDAADIDESPDAPAHVQDLVVALARRKAGVVATRHPDAAVLAGDTLVCHEGAILGQPVSAADARQTLQRLDGSWQQVVTGLALATPDGAVEAGFCATDVRLDLPSDILDAYVESGAWRGKAGGYGIQDDAIQAHASWRGPWSNVVGLPLHMAWSMLRSAGIPVGPAPEAEA